MRLNRILALAAAAALVPLCAPPALAAPADLPAQVRGGHFSPDTPSVDVYLTNLAGGTAKLALSDVGYGDVSDYQRIDPGLYTVGMRPAGADPSTPVAISWTLDAKPGQAFTAMAIGMNKSLQGRVLTDDFTTPPAGQSRVRVIQAASHAPTADIVAKGGPVIAKSASFGATTDYVTVPAGSWPLTAQATGDTTVAATDPVTFAPGGITTVVLLDAPTGGGIVLKTVKDAVGSADAPLGPVDAGGGSTATDRGRWLPISLAALALAASAGFAGVAIRRAR